MSTPSEASFRCQLKGGRLCVLNSGKMYDVTDFVDRHPGGRELIEKHVGEDVTQVMKSEELHKHSPAAFKILEKYYIGEYQTTNGIAMSAQSTARKRIKYAPEHAPEQMARALSAVQSGSMNKKKAALTLNIPRTT